MKLKKGSEVEVLKIKKLYETWVPGTVISAGRNNCIVRFDLLMNCEGDPVVEEVCNSNVRPCPPHVKGAERWMVGDTVEAFDVRCWRVGRIVKVLNIDRFVLRLTGSIQLKEFQISDLRVCQAWRNNKWVLSEKVGEQLIDNVNTSRYSEVWNHIPQAHGILEEPGTGGNGVHENLMVFPPARNLKRKHECNFISPGDVAMRGVIKEKKSSRKAGRHHMLAAETSPLLRQVDVVSFPETINGTKCMISSTMDAVVKKRKNTHPYHMPECHTEESNECSVASCSGNGPFEYNRQHFKASKNISGCSFNDAESWCASESDRKITPPHDKVQLDADVHKLELDAYKLTMQAMYASGSLSWEQESLLTNLRLSLHISNEEHLLHLRQLLSTHVL